jgi:hypothetical protein
MLLSTGPYCSYPYQVQNGDGRYSIIGGVLLLDLFKAPDYPKRIETWTIRPGIQLLKIVLSLDGMPKRVEYPFKNVEEDDDENKDSRENEILTSSFQVSYFIPPHCYLQNAKIMFWDFEKQSWSDEDICDTEVESGTFYSIQKKEKSSSEHLNLLRLRLSR